MWRVSFQSKCSQENKINMNMKISMTVRTNINMNMCLGDNIPCRCFLWGCAPKLSLPCWFDRVRLCWTSPFYMREWTVQHVCVCVCECVCECVCAMWDKNAKYFFSYFSIKVSMRVRVCVSVGVTCSFLVAMAAAFKSFDRRERRDTRMLLC